MTTLLEISEEMLAFQAILDEHLEGTGGEITPETIAIIDTWFSDIDQVKEEKLENYGKLIRQCELLAAARKEEAERLLRGARVKENLARKLKDRLLYFMAVVGESKIETPLFRFSVCKNGGKTPVEFTGDVENLPAGYQKVTVSPDMDSIRAALEAGREIKDARLLPRGTHLRIL